MTLAAADVYDPYAHEEMLRVVNVVPLDGPRLRILGDRQLAGLA